MIPWIIAAAAAELSNMQKKKKDSEDLYGQQLRRNAEELGGSSRPAEVIDAVRRIRSQSADYAPIVMQLIGREFDDKPSKGASAGNAAPRSGVRMSASDFFDDEDDYTTRPGPLSGARMRRSDFY